MGPIRQVETRPAYRETRITGLWQVSGRSELPYEDWVRLDMHYIRNYTIWLDMRVLFNTFGAVLRGSGAY